MAKAHPSRHARVGRTFLSAQRPETPPHANKPREHRVAGDIPELDRLIHERARLGIISALAGNNSLTFNDLKRLLKATDGNLSVHARKLEEAGYISCKKSFAGRIPRTDYRLTATGRRALEQYLRDMEEVINITRQA